MVGFMHALSRFVTPCLCDLPSIFKGIVGRNRHGKGAFRQGFQSQSDIVFPAVRQGLARFIICCRSEKDGNTCERVVLVAVVNSSAEYSPTKTGMNDKFV